MSIRLGNGTLIAGGAQTFPLLSTMWADHILNDVSWLRADTFSWQSGDVYKSVYEKLVSEYATGTTETEGAITFKRTDSGFKIADSTQEQAILDLYNSTGVAWYYILDTTNKRFKLPRTKYNFTGLRDSVGSYVAESLPNIKGEWNSGQYQSGWNDKGGSTGAIYGLSNGSKEYNSGTDGIRAYFDASRSSSTYKDNAPVQQRATQMYLYFFVGNYAQNQTAIDIGQMSEQLNGKADINLNNVSDFSKSITAMMPDYSRATDLLNFPHTATKNGYVVIFNIDNNYDLYIDGTKVFVQIDDAVGSNYSSEIYPLASGQTITCTLTGSTGRNPQLKFIPCKGVN